MSSLAAILSQKAKMREIRGLAKATFESDSRTTGFHTDSKIGFRAALLRAEQHFAVADGYVVEPETIFV